MNKNFSILFALLSLQAWTQENKSFEYQKKIFDEANEYLTRLEYSSAAGAFQYVNELNPKSEIGKIALKKSDSLRPIARQKLKESLIGKWKLVETGSNWGMEKTKDTLVDKILIIDENKFHFYEKTRKTKEIKLVKSEKMNFSKGINESFYSYEFVFSDNQIWYFSVNTKTDKLRQVNTGEEKEIGRTEIVCGNLELYYTRILD